MKAGKRYEAARQLIDATRQYTPAEALLMLRQFPPAKFDE